MDGDVANAAIGIEPVSRPATAAAGSLPANLQAAIPRHELKWVPPFRPRALSMLVWCPFREAPECRSKLPAIIFWQLPACIAAMCLEESNCPAAPECPRCVLVKFPYTIDKISRHEEIIIQGIVVPTTICSLAALQPAKKTIVLLVARLLQAGGQVDD